MSATRRIELPADLLEELERFAQDLGMGYQTTAEAVKDAIRRRIDTLRTATLSRSMRAQVEAEHAKAGGAWAMAGLRRRILCLLGRHASWRVLNMDSLLKDGSLELECVFCGKREEA